MTAVKKPHTRALGVPFTTTLPPDVRARLHELAEAWGLPMSTIIANAVREFSMPAEQPIPYRLASAFDVCLAHRRMVAPHE